MKKSITRIVSVAALTAVALLAQGPGPDNRGGGGSGSANPPDCGHHRRARGDLPDDVPDPDHRPGDPGNHHLHYRPDFHHAIQTQITTAQTALAAAVKTNTTATINTQAAAIGTLQGQIVALNANADAAFYLLLTTDQKTKLNSLGSDFFGQGLGDIHIPGGGH